MQFPTRDLTRIKKSTYHAKNFYQNINLIVAVPYSEDLGEIHSKEVSMTCIVI